MHFRYFLFIFLFHCTFLSAQLSETWREYDSIPYAHTKESFISTVIDANGGFYVLANIKGDVEVFHYNQALQLQWKQRMNMNGIGYDEAVNIVQSPSGLIYVAGTIFDYFSSNDLYVGCLDTLGNIIWEKSWNGPWNGKEYAGDMKILPSGNIAIVGSVQTGSTDYDCIEQVWSPTGTLLAQQELASPVTVTNNTNSFFKISVLSNNCFVACGKIRDSISGNDGILTCFDPTGTSVVWSQIWADPAFPNSECFTAMVTDTGGIFVGGWSGAQNYNHIRHYSNNGTFLWDFPQPLSMGSNVVDLTFDPSGNIGAALRDSTSNLKAIKLNRNGILDWTYTYVPSPYNGSDYSYKIISDSTGNFYLAGIIEVANLGEDQALIKITPNGGFGWIQTRSGTQNYLGDVASNVIVNGNRVYTLGEVNNAPSYYDATISSYDLNGSNPQMITYTDSGGSLDYLKFTSDTAGNTYAAGLAGNQFGIVKRDFQGNLIWKEIYQDSVLNIMVTDIKTDNQGNVYFAGSEQHVASNYDMLILKYDVNGQLQWAITYNGAANLRDVPSYLFPDNNGNLYVAGNTAITSSLTDAIVLKINSTGNIIWSNLFTGTSSTGQNTSGRITAVGPSTLYYTYSAMNIGPNYDIDLVKLDTSGNIVWQTNWDGGVNYADEGDFVGNFTDQNIVVVGLSSTPTYGYDISILKFDTIGNLIWRRTLTNPVAGGPDWINSIAFKGDTLYFCGAEAIPPSYTYTTFYCGAMDSAGTLLWQHLRNSTGGTGSLAYSIAVDKNTGFVGVTGREHYTAATYDIKTILFNPSGIPIDSAMTGGQNLDEGYFISAHDNAFIVGGVVQYNSFAGSLSMSSMIKYCNGPAIQTASDLVICSGDTAQLSSTPGFASYQWSPAVSVSNNSINNPSAWPSSTTTYSVVAINSTGCASAAEQKVIVGSLPNMGVSYSSTPTCSGDTVAIQLSGITSCLWQPSNDLSGISLLSQYAWPPVSQYYFITGYNQWGCTDTVSIFLNRNPLPVVNITSALPDSMCISDPSIPLLASPLSGLFSGDGITNSTFSPSLAGQGYAHFSYNYTDSLTGCASFDTATIFVDSCSTTLILDNSKPSWLIFPNPASEEITIISGGSDSHITTLKLIDASSRVVAMKNIAAAENEVHFNVENIQNGIYCMIIQNDTGLFIRKIIIQH